MAQEQRPSVYKSSVGRPHQLDADLDTGAGAASVYGAMTRIEVWVKSTGLAYFLLYGSRNRVDWRLTQEIQVTAVTGYEGHIGADNAYRYIKVEADRVGEHEIEIVAAR